MAVSKKSLVIVESPTKARTLKKLLDRRFRVLASMGHVRDLPKSKLGVDVDNGFAPHYIVIKGKGPILKELREAAREADTVYLAPDPDREGEAISWHLQTLLNGVNPNIRRIEFHEVTREAVRRALQHPRDIDMNRVAAQQARRVLDRLVGYQLSPLLWRKVRGGLSAGRVQSVALRLVCDREREIESFTPQEYWTITARLRRAGEQTVFEARLVARGDGKVEIPNGEEAHRILRELEAADYRVADVRRRDQQRHPAPPFITSTLQQEANRRLGYSASRTMSLAQQLYEGLDVGEEGAVGLITYMRTDSVRVASSAQEEARAFVRERWGEAYVPTQPRRYTSRRGAQDAHEAIRPTSVFRTPEKVKPYLRPDQYKLYKLIWERFVASQMSSAVLDTLAVDVTAGPYLLRATGQRVKFPGFLVVYRDLPADGEELAEGWLPELTPGEVLQLVELLAQQHFTQPPPRYTEATLVRALEEKGIGRPSTYAPTLETIKKRGYVRVADRRLVPTELGRLVNDLLLEHFPDIVDVGFTAHLEEGLDRVEEGHADWVGVVREFYEPFERDLRRAEASIEEVDMKPEPTGEACPACGRQLVRKQGRFGTFIACSGYPECTYTRPVGIGVACPKCGGEVVERRSRRGRIFYGCGNYPTCDFTSWDRPTERRCSRCGYPMALRRSRRGEPYYRCVNASCRATETQPLPEPVGVR
ncbi:MAG: type I DNA topoisomerase [Armatimonadota bacterium]|nr:type I DNA topoisomerase [Armatimonadota bacterium]MDW8156295.1 type I DNA topoisomerase [Armatimonadota bacterium]